MFTRLLRTLFWLLLWLMVVLLGPGGLLLFVDRKYGAQEEFPSGIKVKCDKAALLLECAQMPQYFQRIAQDVLAIIFRLINLEHRNGGFFRGGGGCHVP